MADGKPCIVEVNNNDYYIPCDRVDDLVVVDSRLINTSSSSITLYREFIQYGDNYSGYPRITCPSYTTAYYRSSSSATSSILAVSSYNVLDREFGFQPLLMVVILGVLICQLFKR